ncbi:TRAP transporter substrate-binding protein [Salipiger abyssi]|uniref:TRAP-type C4-dicarboxylate transport system, periplasmic component n=1 Tax=Salipiger abyssi TaxID=1250539 RepID=A0A1P8UMI4_9RHOB|nr:TRAP transporter substrate-binding protein [Salipiger abyssi]APZ50583.1 TRAP-type C4-dicarboxylate transport system, periplasmic component [Salipiger abyssi]
MTYTRLSLAALLAAGLLAAPASADVKWTFGGINPPGAPVTQASKRFAELVTERTEGRVQVDFYEGSQLGSGPAQIEAMAVGAQEGYISSGSNASNLVTEFGVVDIPFVFEDQDHFLAFMESDLAAGLQQRLRDEFNVRILATNWFRLPRVFLTKESCVESPEDIAGKRARSPNLPMFVAGWEAIGTVPVTIAYGETYMALSQGVADMAESAGEQVFSSKFYEVLPYVTDAQMMYPQNSVYVAESAFQQLSDEDKAIVTQAAEDAGDYFVSLVEEQTAPNRATMEAEGVTFCEMSAETRAAFAAKVADSVPAFEEEGLLPEGWWDQIQAMK